MTGRAATVLFSTYNGARTLPRMLEALCRQTLPAAAWKIVAVDNNSNDGTRQVLDSYLDRLPLEILFEQRQGKQYALTTGLRHLEGDLAILTDDDVIPEPDWVEQFIKVAAEQPDYSIFGGLIEPEWEKQPAPWVLRDAHLGVLYAMNGDLAEGPVSAALVSGPNSAFRRAILGADYVVHEDVGPNALVTQFPMGEDTAFALRLERGGARTFHSRRPKVRHIIKAGYVEEAWMLSRAVRYGMGLVATRPELFGDKARVGGVPAAALLRWLAMEPVARAIRPLPPGRRRFRLLWAQAVRQGILRQFAVEHSRRQRAVRRTRPASA
jgi:glycosyltransferase involved in cell wall biosynthesis